jgi:hypothetical protein
MSNSALAALAATAPGPLLWCNFDPDGTSSLGDREDIYIADYSMDNPNVVTRFKQDNCAGIKTLLEEHPEIETVVFDSLTSFNEMSLKHGVSEIRGATMEMPTLQGYGRRNSYTMQGVMSFIKELWSFIKVRKKFWMIPILLMMAIFGALIVLSQGSAVAPFVYTLF